VVESRLRAGSWWSGGGCLGEARWIDSRLITAAGEKCGLESTLRPRGRPEKVPGTLN